MNFKNVIIIAILFFISSIQTISGQETISRSGIEEDLAILKRNLEDIHAGLYTYSSKQEIDNWFENVKGNLKDATTPIEFYRLLAPLNSIIKNGHTYILTSKLGNNFYFLPIQLYKYKNSYYIKKVFSKQKTDLEGVEILEIDGIPINEIYNRLLQNHARDGNNLTMPSEELSSLFGLEYSIVYGSKPSYKITINKNGKSVEISISQVLLDSGIIEQFNNQIKRKPLSFLIEEGVAVLTFPTFDTKTLKKEKYKGLLENSFAEIKTKNIEHLIIDVRDNGGGDPVPTQELISYLIDNEFVMYKDVYTITNKIKDKKYYKKQGVFWLNLFARFKLKKINDSHYRRRNDEGMDVYLPKKNNFKGQLYILTNGNSFSATGEFTSFIKHNRNNTLFIGEEVGGNEIQNTSGVSYRITLPNSNQIISIPLVVFEMNINAKNNGHGVKPNHWVRNTIEDELKGKDSVMEFTIDLIKKMKN